MNSVCLRSSVVRKAVGIASSLGVSLTLAKGAFAQTASTGSSSLSKGGTASSSLPAAGTTEITYLVFGLGVLLFVVGMMKLVKSFRD